MSKTINMEGRFRAYFLDKLGFEITTQECNTLMSRLNKVTLQSNTVWSNVIKNYAELRPLTNEQVKTAEKYLKNFGGNFSEFNSVQNRFLKGVPTIFERGEGATTAFIVLLLFNVGQPIVVLNADRAGYRNSLQYYRENTDDSIRQREVFGEKFIQVHSYICENGGKNCIRDVVYVSKSDFEVFTYPTVRKESKDMLFE